MSQTRIRSNAAAVYSVAAAMIKDGTYVRNRSVIKPIKEKEVIIIEKLTLYSHSPLIRGVARIFQRGGHTVSPDCHVIFAMGCRLFA